MSYVYIQSEPGLWTVGFYSPDGEWHTDSDHDNKGEAGKRASFLNGGREYERASTREQVPGFKELLEACKLARELSEAAYYLSDAEITLGPTSVAVHQAERDRLLAVFDAAIAKAEGGAK